MMQMKKAWLAPLACLLFSLALGVDSVAAETLCFKCHDKKLISRKVVHAPVKEGKCTSCHNPHVARFAKLLNGSGADFCYRCHADRKERFAQGVVHVPVARGECSACHDPHSSALPGLVAGSSSAGACFKCHDKMAKSYKVTHSPYAKGQCTVCHDPHNAAENLLLKNSPDKLCSSCHPGSKLAASHTGYPGKLAKCTTCHNPHGSNRKGLMRNVLHKPYTQGCKSCHNKGKNDEESCLACHAKVREELKSTHSHLIGGPDNSCVTCHSPHAGDGPGLLLGPEKNSCRQCHANTFAERESRLHRHPGLSKCSSCHAPHGSNELVLMKADHNAVCTACHETQGKFTHPVGDKVFDPRTGQHLTCVSCHNPMGTDFKYHLKASGAKELCVQCHRSY